MKLKYTRNGEPITFERLECGCLITCEQGGVLVSNPQCLNNPQKCKVGEYLNVHKRCSVCGECLLCYNHDKCHEKNIIKRAGHWLVAAVINAIANFTILGIKIYNKISKWARK